MASDGDKVEGFCAAIELNVFVGFTCHDTKIGFEDHSHQPLDEAN